MEGTLSDELNKLSNNEKIKFAKILKTFKGGAHPILDIAKQKNGDNYTTSNHEGSNNYSYKGLNKNMLGGFIGNTIKTLITHITPTYFKGEKKTVTTQQGGDNIVNLTDAINNLNKLLETNQSKHNLSGGSLTDEKALLNKEKKDVNSKKRMKKAIEKKKSVKKSVKPKKKTYKNKNKK